MKRLASTVLAIAVSTAACGGAAAATTTAAPSTTEASVTTGVSEVVISISDFTFNPGELTVAAGTTVTWRNDEASANHTTTADDGSWDSGMLRPGEQFSFTFDAPGTYTYACGIHPSMKGSVVVEG